MLLCVGPAVVIYLCGTCTVIGPEKKWEWSWCGLRGAGRGSVQVSALRILAFCVHRGYVSVS